MSFMGFFPNGSERRLARDEAVAAVERHGERASAILMMKARKTPNRDRRMIYRMAAHMTEAMREA